MNKAQAFNSFWNSFDLVAYDENSVPDNAEMPYITYDFKSDNFNNSVGTSASIWYHSSSWEEVTEKEIEIAEEISRGGKIISYDDGAFWIKKASPWAQRISEPSNEMVKRILLNIETEFID